MSYKGIFEIIVHINNYTAIELPHQGLFSFNVSVYKDNNVGDLTLS